MTATTERPARRTKLTALTAQVERWNRIVPIGHLVDYRGYPEAPPQRFVTRTEAQVLSGHTAVVWLKSKAGCVCLSACTPVEKS